MSQICSKDVDRSINTKSSIIWKIFLLTYGTFSRGRSHMVSNTTDGMVIDVKTGRILGPVITLDGSVKQGVYSWPHKYLRIQNILRSCVDHFKMIQTSWNIYQHNNQCLVQIRTCMYDWFTIRIHKKVEQPIGLVSDSHFQVQTFKAMSDIQLV